jgi:short-subunit dehydrogenase
MNTLAVQCKVGFSYWGLEWCVCGLTSEFKFECCFDDCGCGLFKTQGIGRSLVETLATQGLDVVVVAVPDKLLDTAFVELCAKFPERTFRKLGVDLGSRNDSTGSYLEKIAEATKDIDVQVIFNNAGFMLTGFFDKTKLPLQLCNLECNAVAGVQISHLFSQRLIEKKLKGCIVFTSSAAAYQCTPFTVLYGATKAFVSSFAAGLNVELRNRGIDVVSIHPSPVASRFYDKAHKIDALDFFKQFAVKPEELPVKPHENLFNMYHINLFLYLFVINK